MLTDAQVAEIKARAARWFAPPRYQTELDRDALLADRDELVRRLAVSEQQTKRLCGALVSEAGTVVAARVLKVANAPAAPMEDATQ